MWIGGMVFMAMLLYSKSGEEESYTEAKMPRTSYHIWADENQVWCCLSYFYFSPSFIYLCILQTEV